LSFNRRRPIEAKWRRCRSYPDDRRQIGSDRVTSTLYSATLHDFPEHETPPCRLDVKDLFFFSHT
ncbi:hypothetical protein M407DRAFT_246427, partial [Tulasnella calospora MUT 4182]